MKRASNNSYLTKVLQLSLLNIALLWILPFWAKIILVIFFYYGMNSYLQALALEIKASPIFNFIHYSDEHWLMAIKHVKKHISVPLICLYSIVVLLQSIF